MSGRKLFRTVDDRNWPFTAIGVTTIYTSTYNRFTAVNSPLEKPWIRPITVIVSKDQCPSLLPQQLKWS